MLESAAPSTRRVSIALSKAGQPKDERTRVATGALFSMEASERRRDRRSSGREHCRNRLPCLRAAYEARSRGVGHVLTSLRFQDDREHYSRRQSIWRQRRVNKRRSRVRAGGRRRPSCTLADIFC